MEKARTDNIMRRNNSLIITGLLMVGAFLMPRLFAGTIFRVKYDLLFWNSSGGGYTPILIALGAKLLCAVLFAGCLIAVFRVRQQKAAWILMSIVSVLLFLSVSGPSRDDLRPVVTRGNRLISRIESFHKEHKRYPSHLGELLDVPKTSLVKERRFYYAASVSPKDDKGPWFPSTRKYLAGADYVICVPLVPGGTLVYRPNGQYSDLPGRRFFAGWYTTSRD